MRLGFGKICMAVLAYFAENGFCFGRSDLNLLPAMPSTDCKLVELHHFRRRQNQRETAVRGKQFVNSVHQFLKRQLSVAVLAL